MNPATLQSVYFYILVAGIICTSIGTIGHKVYSKKVDQEKEQVASAQVEKLTVQNDELISGKDKLIVQNDELISGKDELISGKDELIAQNKQLRTELAERDRRLKEVALKDIYKPLSPILRQQLIDSLAQIKNLKEIVITDLNTNNGGKKVVSDLMRIIQEAGINTKSGGTGIAIGLSKIGPQINFNKNSQLMVEPLCKILSIYFKTQFRGVIDDSLDKGVIALTIIGVPLFHQDGTIEFN